ncbi:DUF1801 domain-containing protein [Parasphingorhabdus sp.]|jgi:hypothetical protein|uniref:DUF1801 domain-containing protein n=1 Tax=Parasphingorhabdus sp. TaxID=2709688 RepID=UPI003D2B1721
MAQMIPAPTAAVFDALSTDIADRLRELRRLILATAQENPDVGPLEETLKWGEPAYLTSASRSGTTIRINAYRKSDTRYALFVHCQTDLVDRYKQLYGEILTFEGRRAIIFDVAEPLPREAVKHCIAMALTYHQRVAS